MEATTAINHEGKPWEGGNDKPLGASYGKMMMWFFILSDALTFSGFLTAYGLIRYKYIETWPIADEVFNHFPFLHGKDAPMYFVALMTFILIFSSVTMVLAVDAGKQMKQNKVAVYMFLTIIGGLMFVGSQAWEWSNFINGTYSAVRLDDGRIIQFVDDSKDDHGKKAMVAVSDFAIHASSDRVQHQSKNGLWFVSEGTLPEYTIPEILEGFKANPNLRVKSPLLDMEIKQKVVLDRKESLAYLEKADREVSGANMVANEYGNNLFANFFFFITGFHGFHVVSGIIINIIIFFNVVLGTYQRRGHYEMVEKVGLYWHFVDLVWVFVFTFFYLV